MDLRAFSWRSLLKIEDGLRPRDSAINPHCGPRSSTCSSRLSYSRSSQRPLLGRVGKISWTVARLPIGTGDTEALLNQRDLPNHTHHSDA